MTRYLLDTNIVSNLVRVPDGPVARRIEEVGERNVVTSIIVVAELHFGLAKVPSATRSAQTETVLAPMVILPFAHPAEQRYGEIRAELESRGTPIGANDLLIAAHAMALGCTLVTDNVREFGRIAGLTIENWLR